MSNRLVIIGGDAAGMSAASQVRRKQPDREIIVLDKGNYTSYSACGIPYHVSGDVPELEELVIRSPQEFRDRMRIDVRMQHEALSIDTDRGVVSTRSYEQDRTIEIGYDELLIATGARPMRPPLPGIDGPNVYGVQTLDDAKVLFDAAKGAEKQNVVVVGGGYIGLEMAEAFHARGAKVTVLDAAPQVMSTLDPDMAELVADAMRGYGIDVQVDVPVEGFEETGVVTSSGSIKADLIVLGLGVVPNSGLADEAGMELGARGAIVVDRQQRTPTEGVWAAGDCAESYHQITQKRIHVALGTVANKQGRVAGVNLSGGYATFPGVVGTAITKVYDTEIARTGITEREAKAAGYQYVKTKVEAQTFAHYFPGSSAMTVKMLAEPGTGRVLGTQIVGGRGAGKRIDIAAAAITAGMTVTELMDLDLAYAPPFSGVWDPIAMAARVLEKDV